MLDWLALFIAFFQLKSSMSRQAIIQNHMSSKTRRIVYAVLYEIVAIFGAGPFMAYLSGQSMLSALGFAACMSGIALAWNYVFNAMFERWESRQPDKTRTFLRRAVHGLGFEGGLVFILVPVMAWWMKVSLLDAFLLDLALFAFFFVYTVVFTWVFDKIFGLPKALA